MRSFLEWLNHLVMEADGEPTGDNEKLREDINDLRKKLYYWRNSFVSNTGPTSRWVQSAIDALTGAYTRLGNLQMKHFMALNSTEEDRLKLAVYGSSWLNIMPKPSEDDHEGRSLYMKATEAANQLNAGTPARGISEERLSEIKDLISAGYLARDIKDASGQTVRLKSFPAGGVDNRPFYELVSIIKTYHDLKRRIDAAQKTPEQKRAEREGALAQEREVAGRELARIADTSALSKLRTKLESAIDGLEPTFIEEKYKQWKEAYDRIQRNPTSIDRNTRETWYQSIHGKTEAQTKEVIKEIYGRLKEAFLNRVIAKLGPIVQAKKTIHGADFEITPAMSAYGPSIHASLPLKFSDGSSLVVRQKAVSKISVRNNWFYQFPTTFHNVVFANGTKMKSPSEKAVYEDFAGTQVPVDVKVDVKE